jgi:hypothetical protein
MRKTIKIILIAIIVALVIIQFFRPERFTTPDITDNHITKKLSVPENVQSILKRSCYDCHSNHTVWPWYTNVAPISWLVADDVKKGRSKMNFSEWGKLSASKQQKKLTEICDLVSEDEMPLKNYLLIHSDAKLSPQDKEVLCRWVKSLGASGEDDGYPGEK